MARGCGLLLSVVATTAVGVLGACGTTPSTAPAKAPAGTIPTSPPAPAPSLAPGQPDLLPAERVAQASKAFHALPGYRCDMRYWQKKGAKRTNGWYTLAGKPPKALRLEIREGSAPGTKLLWLGGKTLKARPAGLLSPIVLDLPLDDDRLVSMRGYRLDQIDIPSLLSMMGDPRGKLVYAGVAGGTDYFTTAGSHLLAGTNKMIATLDARTHLPVGVDFSDGREVVFRIRLEGFRVDPAVKLEI